MFQYFCHAFAHMYQHTGEDDQNGKFLILAAQLFFIKVNIFSSNGQMKIQLSADR